MLNTKYTSKASAVLRLFPSGEIEIVINRGQRTSEDMWWWGDRGNLWIDHVIQSGKELTRDDALLALSQVSGITKRTLRHYASIAKFWSKELRKEYEPLPFSHFAVAKSYGDKSINVLSRALSYLEEYNKLPSAEYLEWSFSRQAIPTTEIDAELDKEDALRIFDAFVETEPEDISTTPEASIAVARDWISKTGEALDLLAQSIDPLPISNPAKENIRKAIFDLHNTFEQAINIELYFIDSSKIVSIDSNVNVSNNERSTEETWNDLFIHYIQGFIRFHNLHLGWIAFYSQFYWF